MSHIGLDQGNLMLLLRGAACAALTLASLTASQWVAAQSTDAYHAIQVLPVVVDTASFTQRISIHNPNIEPITLTPTYYPAQGTAEPAASNCPNIVVDTQATADFTDLRQLCPALAEGSMFGTLVLRTGTNRPFSVYSRVSNAAGAGFSVEAFPANNFSASRSMVTGLRRKAASGNSPAYQTNCFVGSLGDFTPAAQPASMNVTIYISQDGPPMASTMVSVAPGTLVRLLDVFAAAGFPPGVEFDHATAEFVPPVGSSGGLISFCTVQDNTSFGADFRIAKLEQGYGVDNNVYDINNVRQLRVSANPQFDGLTASSKKFEIPVGASSNTHILYFRHPDVVGCSIYNATTNQKATPGFGLEMRLIAYNTETATWEVLAGGNDVTSFSNLYLGDKPERGYGSNSTYFVQVESNGQNEGSNRAYKLDCSSGSGHNKGEMIQTGGTVSF